MMDQLSGSTRSSSKDFDPLDWIKFDEEYIHRIMNWTTRWYAQQPDGDHYKGWAMGKVYNSNSFPQSLAGAVTRTPGLYRETDYATGKYKDEYLRRTNEYIHSSVRARVDLAGREVEPKTKVGEILRRIWRTITFQQQLKSYRPQRRRGTFHGAGPLHGWQLMDGHDTHGEPNLEFERRPGGIKAVHWRYEGEMNAPNRFMKEDVFAKGGFEEKLLLRDGAVAGKIVFANDMWYGKAADGPGNSRTF
jgi:hypothetical protein